MLGFASLLQPFWWCRAQRGFATGPQTLAGDAPMNKTAPAVDDVILDKETLAGFPQQPHGGKLVDRVARGAERERLLKAAGTLPKIMIDAEAAITLESIATDVRSANEGQIGAGG